MWVTFENSLDRTQGVIDTQTVENKEECRDMCNKKVYSSVETDNYGSELPFLFLLR